MAGIGEREQGYWQQVEQEINSGWSKYQQAQKAHIAKASARAQKDMGRRFMITTTALQNAVSVMTKVVKKTVEIVVMNAKPLTTRSNILKAGIGYIEPDYWLIEENVSVAENAAGTILMGCSLVVFIQHYKLQV